MFWSLTPVNRGILSSPDAIIHRDMAQQPSSLDGLLTERTSLRTRLLAGFAFLLGGLLLLAANGWDRLRVHAIATSLVKDFGSLLIASVTVAVLWETFAKRAFIDELLHKAQASVGELIARTVLAKELQEAGLRAFTMDFSHRVDWLDLFKNARRVDLFFSYARSWMNMNNAQLEELARRDGARVRVVVPDPENARIVSELARRFEKAEEEIRTSIVATKDDLIRVFVGQFENGPRSDFSLYYANTAPQFAFYRFDSRCVVTMYKHRKGRGGVPVFEAEEGGRYICSFSRRWTPSSGMKTSLDKYIRHQR
jgi:hypothetical protein